MKKLACIPGLLLLVPILLLLALGVLSSFRGEDPAAINLLHKVEDPAAIIPLHKMEDPAAVALLHKMYDRYHDKWHHSRTFNQTTEQYRHDSLIKSTIWYERILYPDKLRIDFDSSNSGNGFMLDSDSIYAFNHHAITRRIKGNNDGLVFILGGLYFMSFDDVLAKFKDIHYDLGKFHNDSWKGRPVLVIGAISNNEKVDQLWIDADKLVPVRALRYDNDTKTEDVFEDYVAVPGGGWSETKVSFYRNDHLIQLELYHDVTGGQPMDKAIFDPASFGGK